MKVVTAIDDYAVQGTDILCFLAGGITKCWEWQDKVIESLGHYPCTDRLVVFNPRRKNFPIDDPNASYEQIKWEFKWLERCDIFSMYFAESESVQPICMYELGRNIVRMQNRFPTSYQDRIVVSCEEGYSRINDVQIQIGLALGGIETITKHIDNFKLTSLSTLSPNTRGHAMKIAYRYYSLTDLKSLLNK